MRAWLLLLAACGGGSDGAGGTLDATVTVGGGAPSQLSEPCALSETTERFGLAASTHETIGIVITWNKALINAPGTYPTGGIVNDLVMFGSYPDPATNMPKMSSGTGMTTFTTYDAPNAVVGTFELSVANGEFTATGSFDCREVEEGR